MSVQTAIYKTALAEIPPGAGKINIFFSRAAVRKVAVDKAESALFAKRMGRRGNVTDPSFVVNGYKTAAFEICFRATENIIHGAVNVTAVKKMHIRALAVKLPSRDKAAVADDEVVGERGKKKRVLRGFEIYIFRIKIIAVYGQRHALPYLFGLRVGVFHGQVIKPHVVSRNAQGIRAESVVFLAVGMYFFCVVAVRQNGCFTVLALPRI